MKILHIIPGKIWGGAEQYILDLGQAFSSRGHEVFYLSGRSEVIRSRMEGIDNYVQIEIPGFFTTKKNTLELAQMIRDKDVVHIHDFAHVKAIMKAAEMSGSAPMIVLTRHIARKSRTCYLNRKWIKKLDRIIFVSSLAKELWHDVNRWMPQEKCIVIHNSIPHIGKIIPEYIRTRLLHGNRAPIIMFCGRIRKSKGCEIIVRSLANLKNIPWEMVFVGACKPLNFDKTLLNIAEKYGISSKIHFYGFSDNVRSLVREADIGVAPSLVREACPLSPMEFMQAGKCIITSDNGAQKEYIVSGVTGLLIAPDSVEQLTHELEIMLRDKNRRDRIGRQASEYFRQNLSYNIFYDRINEVYLRKTVCLINNGN